MAFRIEKAAGALLAAALAAGAASAGDLRFEVRHDHLRGSGSGVLTIGAGGIAFTEDSKDKPAHARQWSYEEIQQLELAPRRLRVLTYEDSRWRLGMDREYRFDLAAGSFTQAYDFLKGKLDQRFVAALADGGAGSDWEIPAKHLTRFGGDHGVLAFNGDSVVFQTDKQGRSRTWRFSDIENISSTGPFRLTLTTYERARSHYGDRKSFQFQLKRPLEEARYDELWRRIHAARGLPVLNVYTQREEQHEKNASIAGPGRESRPDGSQ